MYQNHPLESTAGKDVACYVNVNNSFPKEPIHNSPVATSLDELRGYKTYYNAGSVRSSTGTNTSSVDSIEDSYVTNAKPNDKIQNKSPNQSRKNIKTTIYDENHYALARMSSRDGFEIATKRETSKIATNLTNFQSTRFYCFCTIWLVIVAVTIIGIIVTLVAAGVIGPPKNPVTVTNSTNKPPEGKYI